LSRSRPAVEPTGDDRAGGPDIRLPSAGLSLPVLTTSNPYVSTRSFFIRFRPFLRPASRSFSIQLRPSYISYVPATSQAPYRLRSRLRSSQGGRLRGFDGGFGGPGFGAGNPTMAKGYGQSPSTITIAMLTRWGRFPGAGLGLRCSVSGPRCRVPGTEEGNRAIRRNARLMLRKRAHGVCYAKHSMAMQCHRLNEGAHLSSRWAAGGGPGVLSEPEPSRSIPLRWEGAVRMVETTFSYTQSTCSPRTWPRAVHVVDPRGPHGVQRRRG
jgi:hypothetical protein